MPVGLPSILRTAHWPPFSCHKLVKTRGEAAGPCQPHEVPGGQPKPGQDEDQRPQRHGAQEGRGRSSVKLTQKPPLVANQHHERPV